MDKNDNYKVIKELKNQIQQCRNELLEVMEEWYYMKYVVQPRLLYKYDNIFGKLEFEIKKRKRSANELERRIELISSRINRGQKLTETTLNFIDKVVKREFEIIDKKNPPGYSDVRISYNQPNMFFKTRAQIEREEKIPHMYRTIVKQLHPDLAGEETESFKKHWNNVQHCYKDSDLEHMILFYRTLCPDDEEKTGYPDSEELALKKEIGELKYNINREKRRLEQIKKEEPFTFEEKLDDRFWVAKRKRNLMDNLFTIDSNIRDKKRTLKAITSGKEKPKIILNKQNIFISNSNL